ncbi:hypothetical protein BGE01nite_20950 [Brevifollis gellanilyticus]|uniref:Uncharacterized protein n=1 Tax=Brevifollis gellanilyticus TaxID=748831 RepID=A0A512M7U7_9BACT|nr:hypothetical protein BGE01nite_20950 [Brevifollis gellanilyticus]
MKPRLASGIRRDPTALRRGGKGGPSHDGERKTDGEDFHEWEGKTISGAFCSCEQVPLIDGIHRIHQKTILSLVASLSKERNSGLPQDHP